MKPKTLFTMKWLWKSPVCCGRLMLPHTVPCSTFASGWVTVSIATSDQKNISPKCHYVITVAAHTITRTTLSERCSSCNREVHIYSEAAFNEPTSWVSNFNHLLFFIYLSFVLKTLETLFRLNNFLFLKKPRKSFNFLLVHTEYSLWICKVVTVFGRNYTKI